MQFSAEQGIYVCTKDHCFLAQSSMYPLVLYLRKCPLFIALFSSEFTWCTLHKPALSQLCTEDMQSHRRLLPHGRTKIDLDFQHLQRQTQGFDQHIHACCDNDYKVQPSGSHCTPVSRRRGRWSFLVSSTLFPWWKHSTLHTAHCGHEMLRVVHLKSHTQPHIHSYAMSVSQMCTVRSSGHLVGKGS